MYTYAILIVLCWWSAPTGGSAGEEIVLPFTKTLASWKEFESDEVYKRTPQRPHFPSLAYTHPSFGEPTAAYLTAAFIDCVKTVDGMCEDTPKSELDVYRETFKMFEEQGFDVAEPLSQVLTLLVLRKMRRESLRQQKGMEKEMADDYSKLKKSLVRCKSSFEDKETAK